jgi:hypothetical protein
MQRKTRVTQDVGHPNRWVAQLYYPDMKLWFDIGDSQDTREAATAYLAEHERTLVHPDIPVSEAAGVTYFLCAAGPKENGVPVVTHHLVPKAAGGGSQEHVCTYCKQTERAIRQELHLG